MKSAITLRKRVKTHTPGEGLNLNEIGCNSQKTSKNHGKLMEKSCKSIGKMIGKSREKSWEIAENSRKIEDSWCSACGRHSSLCAQLGKHRLTGSCLQRRKEKIGSLRSVADAGRNFNLPRPICPTYACTKPQTHTTQLTSISYSPHVPCSWSQCMRGNAVVSSSFAEVGMAVWAR